MRRRCKVIEGGTTRVEEAPPKEGRRMVLELPIKAILFDFYLTIVDIQTDERKDHLWQVLASFLQYRGAAVKAAELREIYFHIVQESLDRSAERHPEVDAAQLFGRLLERSGAGSSADLAGAVAQLFRVLSIERFRLYPESREVLETLAERYRLALVSDSQALYIEPELRTTSLAELFEVVVISSELGYRKPDPRVFQNALARLGLAREEVVYVGDSWEHDMIGARDAGIRGIWVCRSQEQERAHGTPTVPVISDLRGLLPLTGERS